MDIQKSQTENLILKYRNEIKTKYEEYSFDTVKGSFREKLIRESCLKKSELEISIILYKEFMV